MPVVPEGLSRRGLLGLGAGVAAAGLAGCARGPRSGSAVGKRLIGQGEAGRPVTVGFLGDSITFGAGSSSPKYAHNYPGQLRTLLAPTYGDAGTGWVLMNGQLWPVTPANRDWDPRLHVVGEVNDLTEGPFRLSTFAIAPTPSGSDPTSYVEFTAMGSSFATLVLAQPGGTSRQLVSVDGGPARTLRNVASGGPAPDLAPRGGTARGHVWTEIPAGPPGEHTLRVWASGGPCALVAVRAQTGAGRVDLSTVAISSQSLAKFCGPDYDDPAGGRYGLAFLDTFAFDLLVVALGTNDYNAGRPLAVARDYLTRLVNRQLAGGRDAVLSFPPLSNPRLYPGGSAPTYDAYAQMFAEVAAELSVPFLDLSHLWGRDFARADAVQPPKYADHTIHPSDSGAHDMAVRWRDFLGW